MVDKIGYVHIPRYVMDQNRPGTCTYQSRPGTCMYLNRSNKRQNWVTWCKQDVCYEWPTFVSLCKLLCKRKVRLQIPDEQWINVITRYDLNLFWRIKSSGLIDIWIFAGISSGLIIPTTRNQTIHLSYFGGTSFIYISKNRTRIEEKKKEKSIERVNHYSRPWNCF